MARQRVRLYGGGVKGPVTMRLQALIVGIMVCASAFGQTTRPADGIEVPRGVVYKPASDTVNQRARDRILAAFGPERKATALADMQQPPLLCGPFLWAKIRGQEEVASIQSGHVTLVIPMFENGKRVGEQKREGKLFQNDREVGAFWKVMARQYDLSSPVTLRKLLAHELEVYWAMIPYDIEEPVFILESRSYRLLLQMKPDTCSILWIDDYTGVEE